MRRAIYPGTFDPFTKGHLHIVEKASRLFDEVIILIVTHPSKKTMFSIEERIAFIQASITGLFNVKIQHASGLTVQFAKDVGACAMIRGIRNEKDYAYEAELASINQILANTVETVFLMSHASYAHISSSNVKTIAKYEGDLSSFVHPIVASALYTYFKHQDAANEEDS